MKLTCLLLIFFSSVAFCSAQTVILHEDFEGAASWSTSTTGDPTDNEWYILPNIGDPFGANTSVLAVSDDGVNNHYSNTSSDAAAYFAPNWPSPLASMDVDIQFDLRVAGEDFLLLNVDYVSMYLVDLDPMATIPIKANLNGSNAVLITEQNLTGGWTRLDLTLSGAQKTFVDGATNDVMIVFTWENDNLLRLQPPAAVDNIIVTAIPTAITPLAGDYTVGLNTGNNFATITDALAELANRGLSSDVNFHLTEEDYTSNFETFPIEIGDGTSTPFTGAGIHTITFKPDPATMPTPTISKSSNFSGGDIDNHGALTLWGISNIVIDGSNTIGGTTRDLTITDNSIGSATNAPMAIYVAGIGEATSQDDIIIKNTNLMTSSQTFGYGILVGQHTTSIINHFADEALFDNIEIDNNSISSVREGIHIDGADRISPLSYNTNSLVTNISITQNELESTGVDAIQERGIHLLGIDNALISQNRIGNFDQSDLNADAGIILDQLCKNTIIERNEIFNMGFNGDNTSALSAHGIEIYNGVLSSNVIIRNNVLRGIGGNGASSYANSGFLNPVAIFLGQGGEVGVAALINQSGYEIYNNSIYMFGEEMDFTTSVSMGLTVSSNVSNVVFKNNLVKNTLGGDNSLAGKASSLAIFAETSNTQLSDINYNGYFINSNTASTNNFIGLIGSIASILGASTDMDGWRAVSGQEESTLYGDPGYTSTNNLLPNNTDILSWVAHNTGVPGVIAFNDFSNTSRPTTVTLGNPDLGAYEFNNDPIANPPPSVLVSGPLSTGTTYDINLYQRKWGSIEFNTGSDLPDDFTVAYYNGIFPADTSVYDVANGYFEIEATENFNTDYDYEFTINYDEAYLGTMGAESADMLISNDPLSNDTWSTVPTTNNTSDNSSVVVNATKFGRMSQSHTTNALPVELLFFSGKTSNDSNLLEWSTASEINNDKFVVQKSSNGTSWKNIGGVRGNGNSNEIKYYSYFDKNVTSKISYYRLHQVDFDGQSEQSKIIALTNDLIQVKFIASPIPASYFINFKLTSFDEYNAYRLVICNNIGVNYHEGNYNANRLESIDVSTWNRGIYLLKVYNGKSTVVKKIILE